MISLRHLFATWLLATATGAGAAEYVRWLEPPDGAAVAAGGDLRLAWSPGPDFDALSWAHEWEIFLSVDGGRTFPKRITPHLDLTRREVIVRAPRLPADDVRLLLRAGNERREVEQALAVRLRVVESKSPRADIDSPFARIPAARRGEPARTGDGGVFSWVIETRGRFVEVAVDALGPGLKRASPIGLETLLVLAASDSPRVLAARGAARLFLNGPQPPRPWSRPPPRAILGLLALIQRLNL